MGRVGWVRGWTCSGELGKFELGFGLGWIRGSVWDWACTWGGVGVVVGVSPQVKLKISAGTTMINMIRKALDAETKITGKVFVTPKNAAASSADVTDAEGSDALQGLK